MSKYIECQNHCNDGRKAEYTIKKINEWVSVKERLPQEEWQKWTDEYDWDVYPLLAVVDSERGGRYVTKLFYTGQNFLDSECVRYTAQVTHWMPLPEPPKEG